MKSPRLVSVDALRGLTVAAMLVVNDAGDWSHVHPWLEHAAWHGITPPDFIFPMFLVIVGVSIALGLAPAVERGADTALLTRKVLARGARIVLLGLALQAIEWWWVSPDRPLRYMGVLQRIGVCYAAVGLVALHLRTARAQWTLVGVLLAGYGALLAAGGSLEPWTNLADRVDTRLLSAHAWQVQGDRSHDPEGVLSTLPSVASALLGLRLGTWLRQGGRGRLVAAGAALLLCGIAWSLWQPLNKQLWTPSFALLTAGASALLLALAHEGIDRRGWPPLGRSLGINAISAYALGWVAICALAGTRVLQPLYAAVFATPLSGWAPWVPSAVFALAFTAVIWMLMRVFERRGWIVTI